MVALVFEFSSLAGRADSVLRPTQKHSGLCDIERTCAVLEHRWNTTVVHRWGWLVKQRFQGLYAA